MVATSRISIWKSAGFLRLWSARTISDLGFQVTDLALPLTAILVLRASPIEVGLLAAARGLPFVVFGLAAGVLIDRARPLALMVGSDLGRALVLGSIPIAFAFGQLRMTQLYLVAFIAGAMSVVFGVAESAAIHGIVERRRLIEANSKMAVSSSAALAAGPALGGALIGVLSAPAAIAVDAVSYLVSAILLARIPARPVIKDVSIGPAGVLAQVREGLRFILSQKALRGLAASLALMNLFLSIFFATYLLYQVRVLHLSPAVIGAILGVAGIAGLAGGYVSPRLGERFGVGVLIVGGAAVSGLALMLIPLAPKGSPIPWLITAESIQVFALLAANATQLGLRQALTPSRLQGRMTATMRFLMQTPTPLGAVVGGSLASTIGLQSTLWIGAAGSLSAVAPLLLAGYQHIRTIPIHEPAWENRSDHAPEKLTGGKSE